MYQQQKHKVQHNLVQNTHSYLSNGVLCLQFSGGNTERMLGGVFFLWSFTGPCSPSLYFHCSLGVLHLPNTVPETPTYTSHLAAMAHLSVSFATVLSVRLDFPY